MAKTISNPTMTSEIGLFSENAPEPVFESRRATTACTTLNANTIATNRRCLTRGDRERCGSAETSNLPFIAPTEKLLAFTCPDKARSRAWETGESWERHLLRFHLGETGLLDQARQILNAALPGAKSGRLTRAFLRALEIGDDQASPGFEDAGDFGESLTLEIIR